MKRDPALAALKGKDRRRRFARHGSGGSPSRRRRTWPPSIAEASHRGIATAIMPSPQRGRPDGSTPRPQAEPVGRASGVEATGRPRSFPHVSGTPQPPARALRSLRATPLAQVQAAPGASVGWAQPDRPVYAPLSTTWLGTPPGPPDDRAARCRAEPDRKGRVGVAHATRKCALVHNTRQAWGSTRRPCRSSRAGEHQLHRLDRGLSLGRAQWPRCSDPPPRRLSCHRPQPLGSGGAAGSGVGLQRRALARDRRRTLHQVVDLEEELIAKQGAETPRTLH
jgi:hypothetical protein